MAGTAEMGTADQLVADLAARACRFGPDRTAFAWAGGTRTYADLHQRSRRLAALLLAAGAAPGTRVALLSENRPEIAELLLAASRLGAVVVPLNYRLAPHEIAYQLQDSGVTQALWEPALADLARASGLAAVRCWAIGDELDAALDDVASDSAAHAEVKGTPRPSEQAPVVQIYTSGTTGRPKGCMLSNRNLLATAYNTVWAADFRTSDRFVDWAPMIHRGGMDLMLGLLAQGATVIGAVSPSPDEIWGLAEQFSASGLSWMPLDMRIFSHPAARRFGAQIERVTHGSSMEEPEMFRQMADVMPNARYAGSYGLSEAGIFVTRALAEDEIRHPHTLGRASVGGEVAVLDADGTPLPPGEVGELCVRGPGVMVGYYGLPAETEAALAGGWLHTGDLASLDHEGLVAFRGRSKDMVKSGGENVYCVEVERVLAAHPDVAEAIVFGVPDPRWGEAVKAVIVPVEGANPTVADLDARCLEFLGGFKRPRWYEFRASDEVPRSTFRKPAKVLLRDQHDPDRSMRSPERARSPIT